MSLLKNSNFNVYPNYNFSGYIEKNPFTGNIIKENNLYVFDFDKDSNYKFLDFNNEYVVKDNLLYKVSKKVSNFILYTKNNNINNIYFEKSNLTKFVKGICNIFDEINISEDIKNEFTVIEPKVNLYFDMEDKIVCNIKFDYNGEIINFGEITENILRNETYENNVIQDIIHNNFFRKENLFYLSDIDEYDNFINMTLPIFSQKYTIFTTEKLDKTNIIKKTNISSHFSIGKDNIFRYDFDFDGIDKKEFDSIFNSISNNKKYYKLKNGNILNLKDKALNEFKSLVYDMSLELDELEECKQYVIPKYKAIYLDSLKQNKYNIIKTNNLFDEFISNFKKYKNISLEIEDKILRNYQIIGLKWLYNIYKCGLGGILADEMGLGKSIQVIYLIKQVLKEKCDSKVLIVAPTSLIYNWENEFNKFGSELKPKVIAGNRTIRKNMFENVNGVNIIITTYGLIKEDKEEYNKLNFELMVIDEAQNIKNPKSNITKTIKNINSNTRIALTGTPIENSVIELWSIFDFIMPGYLNSLNDFQIKYNIKSVENNELSKLDNLNMQINPFILRRKKEDVLVDLPPKIENNIYLDLTDDQKKIYLTELKKSEKEMNEIIEKEGFLKSRFKLLSLITKLRQICIDPKIVFDDYLADSIKINEACDTVKKIISENHKILIFTSYKKALEIVKEKLEKEKISCFVIDGTVSSKKRNELVNSFNNDDTNVFLIMLKAGGTGLNLTGADVVIHLDLWWNPQAENQATDRAHRIGQKNIVQVIKFICKGTIEERILELQNKKKILSDFLIDNGNNNSNLLSSLDENDFRNLFKYSYDE